MSRIANLHPVIHILYHTIIVYMGPINLNYFWNFGSLAFLCLVIQVASGIFLAMHYTPHVDLAFLSVEHIMRDVQYGWFIRYIHANGACFFLLSMFICFVGYIMVHLHTLKKFYELLVLLPFLIMILTAFMGYVFTKKRGLQIHAKILDKKPNKNLLDQKRFMSIEGNLKFFNIKNFHNVIYTKFF